LTWSRNDSSYLLLTLALTVFAVAPLAYPGYVQVHSGFVPAYNLADLGNGALGPGWTPGIATSFDALRSDGLLPYYLGLPVLWLGGGPLAGVKIVFALSLLLGAAGVYVWLRRGLGPGGAALAALVYSYLPYRLAVVYVRGAWGEALFWGLLPWALAAAARLRKSSQTSEVLWLALTALVWALLGLSQAGLTIWAFLLLVVWALWVDRRGRSDSYGLGDHKGRPYTSLTAALGGVIVALTLTLLSVDFTLPPSPIDLYHHFLLPAQLISAFWGFGASRPGWDDGLALGLGFAALGLATLTLILVAARERTQSTEPSRGEGCPNPVRLFALALALSLLLLPLSAFLWRLTGLQHTTTYPWQLLGLIGLCLSVLAGTSVTLDRRLAALPAYTGLVILTLLASYSYLEPRFTQHAPGTGPLAAWDEHHLMLLDHDLAVEIPPAAAGLSESTIGQLSLGDYGSPRAGDTLRLTLTWQATRPFDRDLKLFVHLLDASGQVIAQADPLAGLGAGPEGEDYFTSQWDPGALILNDVAIAIPPNAPPGPYQLAFGLYDGETLERLPVVGQEDARVVVEVGSRE
jgi:hypothetical protein